MPFVMPNSADKIVPRNPCSNFEGSVLPGVGADLYAHLLPRSHPQAVGFFVMAFADCTKPEESALNAILYLSVCLSI